MDDSERSEDPPIRLAAVQHGGTQEIDELMTGLAYSLRDRGFRVGGTVQVNPASSLGGRCDMALEVLTSGQRISISQQLGPESRGCRLNDRALERVVGLVDASLRDGLDILILNKFGKQEAEGRGLRPTIARAVELGIPVLVGLNRSYAPAWREFCAGEGELLEADSAAITLWLHNCLPDRVTA